MDQPAINHLELRWMTTLAAVAQVGSFTVAATHLHLTQSAISQQVAALERWAGLQLLRRRPVELTQAGRIVVARHKHLLSHISQLSAELAQMRDGWLGSLHVGAFLSVCRTIVPKAFEAYNREHPEVVLRLSQMEPGPALAALEHGDLDIAIVFNYGELHVDPGLQAVLVCDEAVQLALPADHHLVGRAEIHIDEIDMSELVPASDAFVYPPAPDDGGFRYIGDDFSVVLALVAARKGIALVPGLAAELRPRNIVLLPLAGNDVPRRRISAVMLSSNERLGAAQLLTEDLRKAGFASASGLASHNQRD